MVDFSKLLHGDQPLKKETKKPEKSAVLKGYLADLFRLAISEQMDDYKNQVFANDPWLICPVTGLPICWSTTSIDHDEPQFIEMLVDVCRKYRWNKSKSVYWNIATLTADFALYHKKQAKLRPVSKYYNAQREKIRWDWDMVFTDWHWIAIMNQFKL